MPSAPAILTWIRHASARPPVRPAPATTLPPSCAGGEGEWEEIQIGPPPAAVEGVAS